MNCFGVLLLCSFASVPSLQHFVTPACAPVMMSDYQQAAYLAAESKCKRNVGINRRQSIHTASCQQQFGMITIGKSSAYFRRVLFGECARREHRNLPERCEAVTGFYKETHPV
jgi:hypothetical protein